MTALNSTARKNDATATPLPPIPVKNPSTPARYAQKLALTIPATPNAESVDWEPSRFVTPSGIAGVKEGTIIKVVSFVESDEVLLFSGRDMTHGLIKVGEKVEAATVSTKSRNPEKRNGTLIQYKVPSEQELKRTRDFKIQPTYFREGDAKNIIFYSGSHLIDHQFGVDNSDVEPLNFYPGHHYVNHPIKNFLATHSASYIEIPLYTPNPPMIPRKTGQSMHPVPVAMLYLQVKADQTVEAYCFPNNRFDYEVLKQAKGIFTNIGQAISQYFKLNNDLLPFLAPAFIHGLNKGCTVPKEQRTKERAGYLLMRNVVRGVTQDRTARLVSKVAHQVLISSKLNPTRLLQFPDKAVTQNSELIEAYEYLCAFLLRYGVYNALKSEVFSVKARLTYLHLIVELQNSTTKFSKHIKMFLGKPVDTDNILKEITKLIPSMSVDELLYTSYTYCELIGPGIRNGIRAGGEGVYEIQYDYFKNFRVLITLIGILKSKHLEAPFTEDQVWGLFHVLNEANERLNEFEQERDEDEPDFIGEAAILFSLRPMCSKLYQEYPRDSGKIIYDLQESEETLELYELQTLEKNLFNLGWAPKQ